MTANISENRSETDLTLGGKTIVVTGGAGDGVGAGVCEALSQCGASLVIVDRIKEKVEEGASRYPRAMGVVADISSPKDIQTLIEQAVARYGSLDGLVNNAGVGMHREAHLASEVDFDHLYGTDVRGLWLMSKAMANRFVEQGTTGTIVNISSVHAHATTNGYAIYASAKSAVEGLTRGMAVELGAFGIRVNAIAPGYVHAEQNYKLIREWTDDPHGWVKTHSTTQQALSREINNLDCGRAVAFLLSDWARAITGQTILVDNGTTSMLYGLDFVPRNPLGLADQINPQPHSNLSADS